MTCQIHSIAALLIISLASCASAPKISKIEGGTIQSAITKVHQRDVDYWRPGFTATHLGIIGSQIGSGNAAHVVGASAGVVIGGIIGFASEKHDSRKVTRNVLIQLDSGTRLSVQVPTDRALRKGQRVWVAYDMKGLPHHLVDTPGDY
jgi:outer membrane lipoprotein SlyB